MEGGSMTDYPITPPPELVEQWCHEDGDEIKTSPRWYQIVATKAARWGSDQELEACCQVLYDRYDIPNCMAPRMAEDMREWLRAARRPKPPSLKEQALKELEQIMDELHEETGSAFTASTIRRALEALPND